ncbi:hypothetical protein Tco_0941690 [Tanacetum coccineum]|uniref:Uncharacterized protein n=1 Tax=Tanacetum coccineum TaxID=301880 RepID=A0ABQ5DRL9_9ASTR
MLAICAADTPVVFKALKTSSNAESVSQGTKPRAKPGHKKLSTSSKQPFVSSKEATKDGSSKAPTSSKTGHSKKRKESSSAMDSNPNQPPVSTPVDTGMHKEDHQAIGGSTSLGTGEARANHQLNSGMLAFNLTEPIYSASFIIHSEFASGNDALAVSTAEADPGKSAPSTDPHVLADQTKSISEGLETILTRPKIGKGASSIARQVEEEEASNTIKLEDLSKQVSNVPGFKDLDSTEDDHVIVVDDSDEDEDEVHTTTEDTSVPKSSSPKSLAKCHKSFEQAVLGFRFCLIKSWRSKCSSASQADTMPAEGEKNTNQATISHLFQRRAKKNAEKENLNNQQPKPTTPPATTTIPPIITTTTNQMQSPQNLQNGSSQPEGEHIKKHKGKKAMSSKDAEEVSTKSDARREGEMRKEELIDLLGPEVVNKYYNDKLQYDRYCDKMLNRRAKSRITNCDILTRKGPITLNAYREDDTSELIPEFKASNLHLGEYREVVKACPKKGINLDRPLSKQDPLDRLNDLANKKRKHADDIHDFFRANKRLKLSVQYKDHPAGTVLNEPVLGMILFNSYHRQDFVTIEDFRDFSNTMLYTVQEILFKLHQGPGLDDHARTFSSLLLAEIDKRNLNPLKQMRVIKQLRQ